jgi:acyl dehydratase
MTDLYFEELAIGTLSVGAPPPHHQRGDCTVCKPIDPVPRHLDEQAAAQSVFGGLTASGAHTFSLYMLLSRRLEPRLQILAGLAGMSCGCHTRYGRAMNFISRLLLWSCGSPNPGPTEGGVAVTRVILTNQKLETVLQCTSTIFVARRPGPGAQAPV